MNLSHHLILLQALTVYLCMINLNNVRPSVLLVCFCGSVVRVLGYRSGGQDSIPGTTRKKVVGLERGPLSLVSTN
jgi:hypothetical protein